ncbi:MAG: nucleotidyltransferase family protein [Clostridia bacterium]|nr:nucleotidyltransferase family protein [Clostridia bacterium]
MPRILGVICEYNPFHLGHAYHLQRAREAAQADYVVAVMSTCFTQRGDAAILSPRARASMALHCGADAVFALPAVWALRDAERFALGGISLLMQLGCDAISFGTEHDAIEPLRRAAHLLEAPDDALCAAMQHLLSTGIPYPSALARAMEECHPDAAALLAEPNSTLALCYLRAIHRLDAQMDVVPVLRQSPYHATALTDALPSATALRGAILSGNWANASAAMPPAAFAILREEAAAGHLHRPDALDTALIARLRTMSKADYAALPDASEGVECRLQAAAQAACTRAGLLKAAKTRRYPYARLSRLAAHALLGLTHDALTDAPLPTPWLLGYRRDARPLIAHLSNHTPLLTRAADLNVQPWFATENRAWDLWTLGAGMPAGLALAERLVTL